MKTDLHIQNFGKVKSADIYLRPFTVIVGPNSSGKSFITKALYSIFHSMNKDLGIDFLINSVRDAISWSRLIEHRIPRISQKDILLFTELRSILSNLQFLISDINEDLTILDTTRIANVINELYISIQESYTTLKNQLNTGVGSKFKAVENEMLFLEMNIKDIKRFVDEGENVYISHFKSDLKQEFLENFQVSSLSTLYSQNEENIFDFSNLGQIQLKNQTIDFYLYRNSIAELQQLYNVVYLESPIYFKLKNALRGVRLSNASFRRKGFLSQVPKYFYDLDQLLEAKISGDLSNEFSTILNKIESCINGSLNISNGEISFVDKDRIDVEIPLNMVSSGISNLGLIGLLIKQNVLSKGSYLFIDEPEVNLHTAWQHDMLDVLVDLSKQGVMVVIATHSLDMIYRFEHVVSQEKQLVKKDHFSLNRLTQEGTSIPSEGLITDIRRAKEDLGRPYVELLKARLP
jgi:putative ABC transporter related protein